jgi:hypothetical protein
VQSRGDIARQTRETIAIMDATSRTKINEPDDGVPGRGQSEPGS